MFISLTVINIYNYFNTYLRGNTILVIFGEGKKKKNGTEPLTIHNTAKNNVEQARL